MADVALIRKMAAVEVGKRALADLTKDEDDSLDQVLLFKAAQAEDRPLFEIAMRLPGYAIHNYEAMGGTFKKQAFGTPMFSAAPAPDPKMEAAGLKPPSASSGSSGPKPPSSSSGPQGSGGVSGPGAPKVQSIPEAGIPGSGSSVGVSAGSGM